MRPVVINVYGDKHKKGEPDQHRICFPGGEIHIERTSNDEYWAHIYINTFARHEHVNGTFTEGHLASKIGKVVGSRIDFDFDERCRARENQVVHVLGLGHNRLCCDIFTGLGNSQA